MKPIFNLNDLQEYSKQIDRQKEVLKLSTIFTDADKEALTEIYELQLKIINHRIANFQVTQN